MVYKSVVARGPKNPLLCVYIYRLKIVGIYELLLGKPTMAKKKKKKKYKRENDCAVVNERSPAAHTRTDFVQLTTHYEIYKKLT